MILKIIFWLFSPILAYLIIGISKDLYTILRYQLNYKSQGIKLHYIPLFGFVKFLMPSSHRDTFHYMKETLNSKFKSSDIVAITNYDSTRLGFFIKSPSLIREFYIKEVSCTKKVDVVPLPMDLGFFMEHGESALKMRGVFNQFFRHGNMRIIAPRIKDIIDEEIQKFKTEKWGVDKGFVEYDLREFFPKIFDRVVTQVLFGDDFPKVDGESIPTASEKLIGFMFTEVLRSPLNTFTFNVLQSTGLLPAYKTAQKKSKKISEACLEIIEKKKKNPVLAEGENVGLIDLMVKHNKTAADDLKISDEKMLANVRLFQMAGQDTSKTSLESVIHHLIENKEYLEKLQNVEIPKFFKNEEDYKNYDSYEKSELLQSIVEEAIRLKMGPPMTFPRRVITKKMKIGKYTIYKGDEVIVPYNSIHISDHWENPNVFKPERFLKENRGKFDRNMFQPFGLGRRNCAGQNMALMVMKMIVVSMLQNFEFEKIEGHDPNFVMRFNYGVEDLLVKLRPRQ